MQDKDYWFEEIVLEEYDAVYEIYTTEDYFHIDRTESCEWGHSFSRKNAIRIRDLLNRWIAKHDERESKYNVPATNDSNPKSI